MIKIPIESIITIPALKYGFYGEFGKTLTKNVTLMLLKVIIPSTAKNYFIAKII